MRFVNLGFVIDDPRPGIRGECAYRFVLALLSCLRTSQKTFDCISATRHICDYPGPGFATELIANLLAEHRELDVRVFEFERRRVPTDIVVELVRNQTLDLWVGFSTMTSERAFQGIFAYPAYHCLQGFTLAKNALFEADHQARLAAAFTPLTAHVWFVMLAAMLLCATSVALFQISQISDRAVACLENSFWISFTQFAGNSFNAQVCETNKTLSRSYAYLMLLWSAACFLIQSLYSSVITSELLLPPTVRATFTTTAELGALMATNQEIRVINNNFADLFWQTYAASNDSRVKEFLSKHFVEKDLEKAISILLADPNIVLRSHVMTFSVLTLNHTLRGKLAYQPDADFKSDFCSFTVNPHKSWLREMINALLQTSLVERLLRKYNFDGSRAVEASSKEDIKPIAFNNFSGILFLLLIGSGACIVVLLLECFVSRLTLFYEVQWQSQIF